MSDYTCGRCKQPSSQQGHYFSVCSSPTWMLRRPGSMLDPDNWREHHFCCPAPHGCELDQREKALIRAAITHARKRGMPLRRDRGQFTADAAILRWKAVKPGQAVVTLTYAKWLPDQHADRRWRIRLSAGGTVIECDNRLTVKRAIDAAVLLGLLPVHLSSQYGAGHSVGVDDAATAIESHAESIGWYEGGGVWAEAIEKAREAAR